MKNLTNPPVSRLETIGSHLFPDHSVAKQIYRMVLVSRYISPKECYQCILLYLIDTRQTTNLASTEQTNDMSIKVRTSRTTEFVLCRSLCLSLIVQLARVMDGVFRICVSVGGSDRINYGRHRQRCAIEGGNSYSMIRFRTSLQLTRIVRAKSIVVCAETPGVNT